MTSERYLQLQRLRAIFNEADVETLRRIADEAPVSIRGRGAEYDVVLELGKAGVPTRDMRYAVDAVARVCDRFQPRDAVAVAQFIAAAAAIGRLHGEDFLLLPALFGYARKA